MRRPGRRRSSGTSEKSGRTVRRHGRADGASQWEDLWEERGGFDVFIVLIMKDALICTCRCKPIVTGRVFESD